MGLLASQINVYMSGNRQLLDENKERNSDTRAVRQNRNHSKSEADKQVSPAPDKVGGAATTTKEDTQATLNSTRVSNPQRKEELSAQRKNKKFKVFGIEYPDSFETQPRTIVSETWTATASKWIEYQFIGPQFADYWVQDYQQQRTNSYEVIPSQTWRPFFATEKTNNRTYTNSPSYTLGKTTFKFDWTFYQSNYPDGTPGSSLIVATLPQLPEPINTWFSNHPRISLNHLPPIAASDGRYIWYSAVYALSRPSHNFYYTTSDGLIPMQDSGNNNRFYDFQNGGELVREVVSRRTQNSYPLSETPELDPTSGYNPLSGSDNFKRFRGWDFVIEPFNNTFVRNAYSNVQAYALVWRYDTQNPQNPPNLSEHNLGYRGDGTFADFRNFASNYLGSLDANHPAKEQWITMVAQKTANESFSTLANRYFDPTYGSGFYSLVPGLVYYKDTGLAIYTGKLKKAGIFPTFPRVYTKTLDANLSYSSASYRLPYPSSTPGSYFKESLTTHEDMLANGWEEQLKASVAQFGNALPYYFTHRAK